MERHQTDESLDLFASGHLAALRAERPRVKGITVDWPGTRLMDDGFSIEKTREEGWVVKVSIADLPAMIPDGHVLDSGQTERLLPYDFLFRHVSLKQDETKPAVTFRIHLDRDLNVRQTQIFKSMFLNKRQMSMDDVYREIHDGDSELAVWVDLARRLHDKNLKSMAQVGDRMVGGEFVDCAVDDAVIVRPFLNEGDMLVHEVMRLVNQAATDFMAEHELPMPLRPRHGAFVQLRRVSASYDFDQACNRRVGQLVSSLSGGLPDYARLTSPMQHYNDYLTLKILGRKLDGLDCDPSLAEEVQTLSARFNKFVAFKCEPDNFKKIWNILRIKSPSFRPGDNTAGGRLRDVCNRNSLGELLLAEREVTLDGRILHFASFSHAEGVKNHFHTQAVSHSAAVAVETAAVRMIERLSERYPERLAV